MYEDQFTPGHDIIDLRDVQKHYDDLCELDTQDLGLDDIEFINAYLKLEEQMDIKQTAENEPVMILDSYFKEYAQDLAEDLGLISETQEWPNYCIDWDRAANDLLMDYTECDFGGHTYYSRGW